MKVLDKDNEEINLQQDFDEDDEMGFRAAEEDDSFDEEFVSVEDGDMDGYTTGAAEDMLDDDGYEDDLGMDSLLGGEDEDDFDI